METIAKYLRQHMSGEVLTSDEVRNFFSTDASIFRVQPKIVVYPKSETDIRKAVRFSWQLAEKGKNFPITARGKGTDQSGAAIGSGMVLVLPAHMNNIMEIDKDTVVVQPGELFGTLQKVLITHGRYVPSYPASIDYSTIGGAVANNSGGMKSIKYGNISRYVDSLRVVLASGDVIDTKRFSKREVAKKMGLTTLEGDIYRAIDALISDNWETIQSSVPAVSKAVAGYNIWDVKRKDGSIDLTPLFVGGQGTLGIISQIKLKTEQYNPHSVSISASFDDNGSMMASIKEIKKLNPASLEIVDSHMLEAIEKYDAKRVASITDRPFPSSIVFVRFDDNSGSNRSKKLKKAKRIFSSTAREFSTATTTADEAVLWKVRHAAAAAMWESHNGTRSVPVIEDAVVPGDSVVEHMENIYKLFKKHNLNVGIWGHVGEGHLRVQPHLDLSNVSDRQKIFRLMDEFYELVLDVDGTSTGSHGDGRLRAPYLKKMFSKEMYSIFEQTKKIFDPYNIMNPGVKFNIDREQQIKMLRQNYTTANLFDHLPWL